MRNLTDLTQEELKALFKANKHLQEKAQENLLDNAYFWINEYLQPFGKIPGVDYSISCYYDYFTVKSPAYYLEFLEGVEKMQKDFCILSESTAALFSRVYKKAEFFREAYNGYEDISDKRFLQLEKWMIKAVETITSEILKCCQEEIMSSYDFENQETYFLDFIDNFDCYQVEENKLYKTVCYCYT